MRNFKALQKAKNLYLECEKLKAKDYFKNQMERAALSVVLNLSEGYDKESWKDKKRFYEYSLTSLRETQMCLELLQTKEQIKLADELGAMVFKLVQYARSRI